MEGRKNKVRLVQYGPNPKDHSNLPLDKDVNLCITVKIADP